MKRVFVAVLVVLVVAGCGGGSPAHRSRTVTIPSYAGFPSTTIVGTYSASACARDAAAFAREGRLFAQHSGPDAAYSADTYYIDIRRFYSDFEARDCDPLTLGHALRNALTTKQRRLLVNYLPGDMAQSVRDALRAS
jgi:hypothetical protein